MAMKHTTVLGTGAWGTAFAQVLADSGMKVRLWGRNRQTNTLINEGENSTYLPGIELSPSLSATDDLGEALHNADLIAVAIPVAAVRDALTRARNLIPSHAAILSLAKGLELSTHKTVHRMITEASGVDSHRVAVLSGPNLSREIAEHHPTATVIACENSDLAAQIAEACHTSYFRPYVSTDVIGCEIAGATKNVIAVAIGAAEGYGLGTNSRSTLITRGLAEMTRLGTRLGADPGTFAGLSGVGDLVATCSSRLSRNYSFGVRMGQGMSCEDALAVSPGVVEGAHAARPILELAHSLGVDMPITEAVVRVVHEGASVKEMGDMLLSRPKKMDGWKIEFI